VSGTELIEVMRLLRLVLEKEKVRDSFRHAALYCDWLLHNEIDRHEIAINIAAVRGLTSARQKRELLLFWQCPNGTG
jgi:hypothetical protein